MEKRLVSGKEQHEEEGAEISLRPTRLEEFIGQNKIKENLGISIKAAQLRGEPLDHVLFYGPPGLGKTTLGHIISAEMGVGMRVTSGPAIERAGDMAAILTSLKEGDILFIDEIHRLSRVVEEVLYSAVEDFYLSWMIGKGLGARSMNLKVNPFTLIGATTRFAMLSAPLRDRFGSIYRLDFYEQVAMEHIVQRSGKILGVQLDAESGIEIARRSRGTPRVANRLLKRTRDYAQVKADGIVTQPIAIKALSQLEIDPLGLDDLDHRLLLSIIEKFSGGPVGLDTLSASISEEPDTIMDIYEPYLMQLGFMERTPRGRTATRRAYEHLGINLDPDSTSQQGKFI
jgi:Holliday junction DNA helicase RuvB